MIKRKGDKIYVKSKGYDNFLIVGLIKKISLYKMSYFSEPYTYSNKKLKFELDLANYVTKSDLKNAADVDTSKFAKKSDSTNLKSYIDRLDI